MTTFEREIKALIEGMSYFNLENSYLVTSDRDEIIKVDEKSIEVISMWRWLLI